MILFERLQDFPLGRIAGRVVRTHVLYKKRKKEKENQKNGRFIELKKNETSKKVKRMNSKAIIKTEKTKK